MFDKFLRLIILNPSSRQKSYLVRFFFHNLQCIAGTGRPLCHGELEKDRKTLVDDTVSALILHAIAVL